MLHFCRLRKLKFKLILRINTNENVDVDEPEKEVTGEPKEWMQNNRRDEKQDDLVEEIAMEESDEPEILNVLQQYYPCPLPSYWDEWI